jgi:hypothetical protein
MIPDVRESFHRFLHCAGVTGGKTKPSPQTFKIIPEIECRRPTFLPSASVTDGSGAKLQSSFFVERNLDNSSAIRMLLRSENGKCVLPRTPTSGRCTTVSPPAQKVTSPPVGLLHRKSDQPDRSALLFLFGPSANSSRLHVVAEQRVLIANVELAVRKHWMRPGGFVRAFGLIEPPALQVFLAAGFN